MHAPTSKRNKSWLIDCRLPIRHHYGITLIIRSAQNAAFRSLPAGGAVTEEGAPAQLPAQGGAYAGMCELQRQSRSWELKRGE